AVALGIALMAGVGFGGARPAAAAGQPDLVTNFEGNLLVTSDYYVLKFTVKDAGTADATSVVASGKARTEWYNNTLGWKSSINPMRFGSPWELAPTSQSLGTLKPGQTATFFAFVHKFDPNAQIWGMRVTVTTPNEANPFDNTFSQGTVD